MCSRQPLACGRTYEWVVCVVLDVFDLSVHVLQDVLGLLGCSEDEQSKLVGHLLSMHQTAEAQLAAAPRQFLSCVELYGSTVVSKREQLLQQQKFLKVGWHAGMHCSVGRLACRGSAWVFVVTCTIENGSGPPAASHKDLHLTILRAILLLSVFRTLCSWEWHRPCWCRIM